jgi:hypothetical protein
MTQKQFDRNYATLVRKTSKMLLEFKRAALASGAVDLKSDRGDWGLPKDVITAALMDATFQWKWPGKTTRHINNIRRCAYPDYSRIS